MKLSELDDTERLALMAVLKLVISADKQLSAAEGRILERVADEVGRDVFNATREAAEPRLTTSDDVKAALRAVTRPEVQVTLYRLAWEAAESDQLIATEIKRLFMVAELWGIDVDPSSGRPA